MATTNTITGQLNRISEASKVIWNKAKDMNLLLPAGSYWDLTNLTDETIYGTNRITSSDSGAASYIINQAGSKATYNFGIDAVAAAIKNINSQNVLGQKTNASGSYITGDTQLDAGESIYIPVGYNITPFTITGSSVGSQLKATDIQTKHLYKDITAYAVDNNGTVSRISGSLSNVYLYNPSKAYDASKVYKDSNNVLRLQVSINSDWASNKGLATPELLNTNIPYISTQTIGAVTGSSTQNGTIGVQNNLTVDSYNVYSGASQTGKTATKYLKLTPTPGYYDTEWSTNILYDPILSQTVEITRTTDPDGNTTAIANTLTVPAGYYSKDVIITPVVRDINGNPEDILNYANITIGPGDYTFTGGKMVFSPATFDSKAAYDYFGTVTITEAAWNTTTTGQLEVIAGGWLNKGSYGKAYGGLPNLTTSQITSSSGSSTINSQSFTITVDDGYHTALGEVTKTFSVAKGSHSATAAASIFNYNDAKFGGSKVQTINVNVSKQFGKLEDVLKAGWIDAATSTTYFKIINWARKGATTKTADYYTVGTPGWIDTGSYVGSSIYTPTSEVYDPNNAGADLTIKEGTVLSTPLTVKRYVSGAAEYTVTEGDLANTDGNADVTKITISASKGEDQTVATYMTSVTVDMSLILEKLQGI